MDLSELAPGDYRLLAWAGLNAQDYTWTEPAPGSSIDDFRMSVQMVENRVDRELSGLFQGELEYTIPIGGTTDTEFPLVKNTNKFHTDRCQPGNETDVGCIRLCCYYHKRRS